MSTELVSTLAQEPSLTSTYISDAELRDMAIVWAVAVRNATQPDCYAEYRKRLDEMKEHNPELYRRFGDYLAKSADNGTSKEWSLPAERIRHTLLSKE